LLAKLFSFVFRQLLGSLIEFDPRMFDLFARRITLGFTEHARNTEITPKTS